MSRSCTPRSTTRELGGKGILPGYNIDRGPVVVGSLRLHVEI
jgi:hypothetical protein